MINRVKTNKATWIACDVGKCFDHNRGILAPELFNYDAVLNTSIAMDKENALQF